MRVHVQCGLGLHEVDTKDEGLQPQQNPITRTDIKPIMSTEGWT
jgi:hypothetical protein